MNENEIVKEVLNSSFQIHSLFGPGLLETVYRDTLAFKLKKAGFMVQKEICIPLVYEELQIQCGYRADLIVNKKVVIEIKTVEQIAPVHLAQTLTYLKLGHYKLGLLLNFNTKHLRDGIRRVVNGL